MMCVGRLSPCRIGAAHTPLRRLMTDVRTLSREPRDVARWAKHRLASFLGRPTLPFPKELFERDPREGRSCDFFHPEVREAYRSWWEGRRREFIGDADPWCHRHHTPRGAAWSHRVTNGKERDRFELSYATRLNRTVGLYFGWRA
jgi:hypothetical protein